MTPIEKLKLMAAWEATPALTEAEVEALLDAAAVADENGSSPQTDTWVPTYDLNRAAATAWLIKAARSSDQTEVDPPDSGIVTSRVFENCLKMSRVYTAKATASVRV
jgi:hypothetical protein